MNIVEQMLNKAQTPLLHIADVSGSALFQGDCLDIMPLIPDNSIDCVITDPPYGTTANKWDSVIPFDKMWEQLNRIIKPNVAILLFASQPFTSTLICSNLKMFKYCWTWDKVVSSGFLNAKKQPLRRIEDICVFYDEQPTYNPQFEKRTEKEILKFKAKQSCNGVGTQNYNEYNLLKTENVENKYPTNLIVQNSKEAECNFKNRIHPTQKPLDLMKYFIQTYTNETDMVLDNTMGSGTTCLAAKELNRKFIGIEKEPKYYEIACQRCGF